MIDKFLRSKTPIFIAAGLSFVFAYVLWFSGYKQEGMFVALWVPAILSLGAFVFAGRCKGE